MDKVQKHKSFNTNTPSSESYRKNEKCLEKAMMTSYLVPYEGRNSYKLYRHKM